MFLLLEGALSVRSSPSKKQSIIPSVIRENHRPCSRITGWWWNGMADPYPQLHVIFDHLSPASLFPLRRRLTNWYFNLFLLSNNLLTLSARRFSTVQFLSGDTNFPIISWTASQCRGLRQGLPRAMMVGSTCLNSVTDCLRWVTRSFLGKPTNNNGSYFLNQKASLLFNVILVSQLSFCIKIMNFINITLPEGIGYGLKQRAAVIRDDDQTRDQQSQVFLADLTQV